jgi:putative ABC transport system substrate-binding protein
MTRRWPFIAVALLIGTLIAPLAGSAQQAASSRRIGFLSVSPAPQGPAPYPYLEGFRQGLRERGWIEGQNLTVEYRWAAGKENSLPDLARVLLRLNVDVIVTYGNKPPHVIKDIVKTTPIVPLSCDPLETMVVSLARPAGNITGLTCLSSELTAKKLELLLAAVPNVKRLVILYNPNDPGPQLALKLAQEMAAHRQLKLEPVAVSTPEEFEPRLATIAQLHPDAMYVYPDPLTARFAKVTIDFAAKHRLPAVYGFRQWPDAGGLMSYGSNLRDLAYRGAGHVDKILKGAKPADLPVEQPTKFELVINLKTARALGLTIPQSLLGRADQLIE